MTNRVRIFREKAGMSQVELARRACIAPPNLSSIEHGRVKAWPIARKRLARALKCKEDDLFPGGRNER